MKIIELDENKILFNWVKTVYGKKCSTFEENCPCCIAWILYDRLIQKTELLEGKEKTCANTEGEE